MRSDIPSASIAAAVKLLDRGWGKAAQPLVGDDKAPAIKFEDITDEMRVRALGMLFTKLKLARTDQGEVRDRT
jgi:hypothetical protein